MSFNFDPSLTDPISRVRQYLGDTVVAGAELEDETIQAYLSDGLNVLNCAAQLARDLAAKYAGLVDTTFDHQETRNSQKAKGYVDLATRLQNLANSSRAPNPISPTISVMGLTDCRGPLYPGPCHPWLR